jgi:hypothetical protein
MFTIAGVAAFGGLVGRSGELAEHPREPRRPPAVSVIPALFSLVMAGSLIAGNLGKTAKTPSASSAGEASWVSQSALRAVPVYPGPSNGAPLPRLNLPITYDYGPGPRHPVPPSSWVPPTQVGADGGTQGAPRDPSITQPGPSAPVPSCASAITGPATPGSPIVIGPCTAPPAPAVP